MQLDKVPGHCDEPMETFSSSAASLWSWVPGRRVRRCLRCRDSDGCDVAREIPFDPFCRSALNQPRSRPNRASLSVRRHLR